MALSPWLVAIIATAMFFSFIFIAIILAIKLGVIPAQLRAKALVIVAVIEGIALTVLIVMYVQRSEPPPAPPAVGGSRVNPEFPQLTAFSFDHVGENGLSCTHKTG